MGDREKPTKEKNTEEDATLTKDEIAFLRACLKTILVYAILGYILFLLLRTFLHNEYLTLLSLVCIFVIVLKVHLKMQRDKIGIGQYLEDYWEKDNYRYKILPVIIIVSLIGGCVLSKKYNKKCIKNWRNTILNLHSLDYKYRFSDEACKIKMEAHAKTFLSLKESFVKKYNKNLKKLKIDKRKLYLNDINGKGKFLNTFFESSVFYSMYVAKTASRYSFSKKEDIKRSKEESAKVFSIWGKYEQEFKSKSLDSQAILATLNVFNETRNLTPFDGVRVIDKKLKNDKSPYIIKLKSGKKYIYFTKQYLIDCKKYRKNEGSWNFIKLRQQSIGAFKGYMKLLKINKDGKSSNNRIYKTETAMENKVVHKRIQLANGVYSFAINNYFNFTCQDGIAPKLRITLKNNKAKTAMVLFSVSRKKDNGGMDPSKRVNYFRDQHLQDSLNKNAIKKYGKKDAYLIYKYICISIDTRDVLYVKCKRESDGRYVEYYYFETQEGDQYEYKITIEYDGDNDSIDLFDNPVLMLLESVKFSPNKVIPFMLAFFSKNKYKNASFEISYQDLNAATQYYNDALIYQKKHKYKQAIDGFKKALKTRLAALGDEHQDVLNCYQSLGDVYTKQRDYTHAIEYYNKVLNINLNKPGSDPIGIALILENIAYVYYEKKQLQESLKYNEKAYQLYLAILGEKNIKTRVCLRKIEVLKRKLKSLKRKLERKLKKELKREQRKLKKEQRKLQREQRK